MRRNWCGLAAVLAAFAVSSTRISAQSMAEMGAASSMSSTLGGGGGGMSTRASDYTRGLPSDLSSLGSPGTADAMGGNFGANQANGAGGYGANGNPATRGGVAATARVVAPQPFHWNDMRGADFIRELQRRPTVKSSTRIRARRGSQRRPLAKYKIPPRGFLSYYLAQDRYKITQNIWRYVSIEDDRGRYPVRYYYRPNSPSMLALLSASPRGVRRYNRVIGFKTWRDAMTAGFRPDPVSKPEPAARVLQLASFSRSDATMRYIEAAYAGQMSPDEFNNGIDYAARVGRLVRSNSTTRARAPQIVNQIVLALLGEAPFPTQVIGTRIRTVTVDTTTTTTNGNAPYGRNPAIPSPLTQNAPRNPNVPANGGENRMGAYNNFQNNAASLRR